MHKCRILVRFQPLNNTIDAAIESTMAKARIFNDLQLHMQQRIHTGSICLYQPLITKLKEWNILLCFAAKSGIKTQKNVDAIKWNYINNMAKKILHNELFVYLRIHNK